MATPLAFLDSLTEQSIPNDTEEQVAALGRIAATHPNVDKVELLPFRKICQVKYDSLEMEFPFAHIPEPTKERMQLLEQALGLNA